jgi:SHS2 domain-containing protein
VPYRWVEHTGELELEIRAADERAVFAEGFEAMRELLAGGKGAEATRHDPHSRDVKLAGSDQAALLADWLAELAVLGETEGLIPDRLSRLAVDPSGLRATVEGRTGSPSHLVKGATYHRLAFEPSADGWFARVVLDV